MNIPIFEELHHEGLIAEEALDNIKRSEAVRPVTLQWELRTLMYVGILLLTTGLGILVYKNLDSIGHLAIVTFIAAAMLACFAFSIAKAPAFAFQKASSNSLLHDYVLLLGCLLLLILVGYLQFQYQVFGNRWGMATFVPMVVLFIAAYRFDHLGVLSLAIVNLAAWAGITVTPLRLLKSNDFNDAHIIFTGIALGIFLLLLSEASVRKNIKTHFSFTYKNFGCHLLFISSIAAIIHFDKLYLLWFVPLALISFHRFVQAVREKSFYFLVVTTLYFYAGLSYVIMRFLFDALTWKDDTVLYIAMLYFIGSGLALTFFLIKYNKLVKKA